MSPSWGQDLAAERDAFRAALGGHGFADDGELLRGPVLWRHPDGRQLTATIDVGLDDRFPFAPPTVQVADPGMDLKLTFHREPNGRLSCGPATNRSTRRPGANPGGSSSKSAAGWR